jgi:hypothetical protein
VDGGLCLVGIRIWNYNANMELSYIGAKHVRVQVGGTGAGGMALLRRAPGHACYDFLHHLHLAPLDDRFSPFLYTQSTKGVLNNDL